MILERVTKSRSAAVRIVRSDVIPRQRILGARQRNVAAPRLTSIDSHLRVAVMILAQSLPLFCFRQYDEPHEFLRDDLPVLAGPGHLRAQEVAGDRPPGGQGAQRISARFERIQGADRAGNRPPRGGKAADNSASQPSAGRHGKPLSEGGVGGYLLLLLRCGLDDVYLNELGGRESACG